MTCGFPLSPKKTSLLYLSSSQGVSQDPYCIVFLSGIKHFSNPEPVTVYSPWRVSGPALACGVLAIQDIFGRWEHFVALAACSIRMMRQSYAFCVIFNY